MFANFSPITSLKLSLKIGYKIAPTSTIYDFANFRVERSSDQVIKPVNLEALNKWVGQIPEDVVRDMADIAPMLSVLGYDPFANPPDYGKPDAWVEENTFKVRATTSNTSNTCPHAHLSSLISHLSPCVIILHESCLCK